VKRLKVNPQTPEPEVIAQAVEALKQGKLVIFPTETVYGLGADGLNSAAVRRVYEVKGRPFTRPLPLLIEDLAAARRLGRTWPEAAERLGRTFWPGPLTIVVPAASHLPAALTAGGDTVGLRCPDHPVPLALLSGLGKPLAAPSANLSGHPSPTTAAQAARDLAPQVAVVLDGGTTNLGLASTVVDVTHRPFRLLREGSISREQLMQVLEEEVVMAGSNP